METILRASSLCPGKKTNLSAQCSSSERGDVMGGFFFYLLAIQHTLLTLGSCPFLILHVRTGCAEGSSEVHGIQCRVLMEVGSDALFPTGWPKAAAPGVWGVGGSGWRTGGPARNTGWSSQ
jgi:hypothetical protein